jgi:hypothetical protein
VELKGIAGYTAGPRFDRLHSGLLSLRALSPLNNHE